MASINNPFGIYLQRVVCERYRLGLNASQQAFLDSVPEYPGNHTREQAEARVEYLFERLLKQDRPIRYLSRDGRRNEEMATFELASGATLLLQTHKRKDDRTAHLAPRGIGQAGIARLNEIFRDIWQTEIADMWQFRVQFIEHYPEMLPVYVEHLAKCSYIAVICAEGAVEKAVRLVDLSSLDFANHPFTQENVGLTRKTPTDWTMSQTVHFLPEGAKTPCSERKSIADIIIRQERSPIFRFHLFDLLECFNVLRQTRETFGISTEVALCKISGIDIPEAYSVGRWNPQVVGALVRKLKRENTLDALPRILKCVGPEAGKRGGCSKSPHDFELEGGKTLSVKSNINNGTLVCPPNVGQPGKGTAMIIYAPYLNEEERTAKEMTAPVFKRLILERVCDLFPMYISHLFSSDYLFYVTFPKQGQSSAKIYNCSEIKAKASAFHWDRDKIGFTRETIDQWNENNTVRYDGKTLASVQVHSSRSCFEFRLHLPNLLSLLEIPSE